MKVYRVAACLAAVAMVISVPAAAGTTSRAEKLRRLDIMLMVTGLRCRNTADNFQPDYVRFTANHYTELNAAAAELRSEMAIRFGAAGANRALDKLSVQMANQYGQGHPWLDCYQLKQVTRSLAEMRGPLPLAEAADNLLEDNRRQLVWSH